MYAADNVVGLSITELITRINTEQIELDKLSQEKNEELIKLKADAKALEKASENLETAQGERTVELDELKKNNAAAKEQNNTDIAAAEATKQALASLQYETWAEASKACKQAETKIKDIDEAISTATKKQENATNNETFLKAKLDEQKKTLEKIQKEESSLKGKFEELLSVNKFSDEDDFLGFVVSEKVLSATQKEINEYKTDVKSIADQLKTAKADAKGKEFVDVSDLFERVDAKETVVKEIRKRQNEIKNRKDNNADIAKKISNQKTTYEEAQAAHAVCSRLYKLVKGDTGSGKITLEQYIQAAGFDGIILAANRRLLPMSEGQYELYRQEESLGRRSNTFLDLEVLDNFTGHRRPVGNLSGGESFKASLSLALGLSDTVSSNMGGVQMDALFIDEGFGTLDRKSIDSAMETLLNLSCSNKLVGVISHREELIENIPQQIKVSKGKDGSKVTIETGM
jgi:exonuclease SbcC